jgi:hypothetical protein
MCHVGVINGRKLEGGKLVLVGRDVHLQPNFKKMLFFHICAVHLVIIKVLFMHQLMH